MIRQTILTSDAPQPLGPYSQAVRAGGFLFVAGQLPLDRNGVVLGDGDIARQTETVLSYMEAILHAAGSGMEKVVKTTVFLTNLDDFRRMNEIYARFFAAPYPARSTVEISRLPKGLLIEVECVALA